MTAAAPSPTISIASAAAATGSGKNTAQRAAETHIHVAPLITIGPPNGGCSSGRMMGANTQLIKRCTAGIRSRSTSSVTATVASGTRSHIAAVRPSTTIPRGITSAPRWSAFRFSSAE
jgi:hypothetical protein